MRARGRLTSWPPKWLKLLTLPGFRNGGRARTQLAGGGPVAARQYHRAERPWRLALLVNPRYKYADLSQRAFPDRLELYSRIQAAIVARLSPLDADMAARDAARHLRIPGSLNSGSETNVERRTHGANESGHIYTLPQLAKLFRTIPTKRHHREIIANNPAKRRGWVALNAKRLRNFDTLRALLRANGVPRSDVLGLLTDMGSNAVRG